jgi:hypothetical protein
VTGPEHYQRGERLLASIKDKPKLYSADDVRALSALASAHFAAAVAASALTTAGLSFDQLDDLNHMGGSDD